VVSGRVTRLWKIGNGTAIQRLKNVLGQTVHANKIDLNKDLNKLVGTKSKKERKEVRKYLQTTNLGA